MIAESSADETEYDDKTAVKVSCCLLTTVLTVYIVCAVRCYA